MVLLPTGCHFCDTSPILNKSLLRYYEDNQLNFLLRRSRKIQMSHFSTVTLKTSPQVVVFRTWCVLRCNTKDKNTVFRGRIEKIIKCWVNLTLTFLLETEYLIKWPMGVCINGMVQGWTHSWGIFCRLVLIIWVPVDLRHQHSTQPLLNGDFCLLLCTYAVKSQ